MRVINASQYFLFFHKRGVERLGYTLLLDYYINIEENCTIFQEIMMSISNTRQEGKSTLFDWKLNI